MVTDYHKRKVMPKCGKDTSEGEMYNNSNTRSSVKKSRINMRCNFEGNKAKKRNQPHQKQSKRKQNRKIQAYTNHLKTRVAPVHYTHPLKGFLYHVQCYNAYVLGL